MQATIVPDIDEGDGLLPGAIELRLSYTDQDIAGLGFRCPCGCGREGYLPIRFAGTPRRDTPEWEWDGNETAPTLRPSVAQVGGCQWHGWLTAGVWSRV